MRVLAIAATAGGLLAATPSARALLPAPPSVDGPAAAPPVAAPVAPVFPPAVVDGRTAAQWRGLYLEQRRRTVALTRTLLYRPSVAEAIALAATVYHQSYGSMRRRAVCESRLDPGARNASTATGLFQLLYPSTWRTTPFARFSPFSPFANALAAGYMLAHGRSREWVCGG